MTGVSSFYMLYGREAVISIDASLGSNPNPVKDNFSAASHIHDLVLRLSTIREVV